MRAFRQSPISRGSPRFFGALMRVSLTKQQVSLGLATHTTNPHNSQNQTLTTRPSQPSGLCYGCEGGCVTCAIFLPHHVFYFFILRFFIPTSPPLQEFFGSYYLLMHSCPSPPIFLPIAIFLCRFVLPFCYQPQVLQIFAILF